MRLRLVSLQFSPVLGGFDTRPLEEVTRNSEILEVRDHFYFRSGIPHLALLVLWPRE